MNNQNLDLIRQKCIEANPEIAEHRNCGGSNCSLQDHVVPEHPIRLADVLLAIKADGIYISAQLQISNNVAFGKYQGGGTPDWIEIAWNLRKDSLEDQSEKTINFLADLLR